MRAVDAFFIDKRRWQLAVFTSGGRAIFRSVSFAVFTLGPSANHQIASAQRAFLHNAASKKPNGISALNAIVYMKAAIGSTQNKIVCSCKLFDNEI